MKKQPRGIRNNNPGNINKGIGFQGEVAGDDSRFATFASPELGIRALTKNLMTYDKKYGLNTVQGIINRWAPPNENNTGAYVNVVAKALGVNPTDKLNMRDPTIMAKLASSIIQHENGQNPYTAEQINAGVNMALGNVATPSVEQRKPGIVERVVNAMVPTAHAAEPQAAPTKKSMSERIAAAREAGYSDEEIIQHLSKSKSFTERLAKAREAGYSDDEVYKHLGLNYRSKKEVPNQAQSQQKTHDSVEQLQSATQDMPQKERGFFEQVGDFVMEVPRQVGLTARYGLEGIGQTADIITEPVRNYITDPISQAIGLTDRPTQSTSKMLSGVADTLGLPKPKTSTERVVGDMSRLMAGTAAFGGVSNVLGNMAQSNIAQTTLKSLGANPGAQMSSAMGSGLLGGAVREAGGSDTAQAVASVAGGLLGPMVLSGAQNIGHGIKRMAPVSDATVDKRLIEASKRADVDWDGMPERIKNALRENAKKALSGDAELDGDALRRMVEFQKVGATPTRGTLSLDPAQITRERNLAKLGASAGDGSLNSLSQIESNNNRALINALNDRGANSVDDIYSVGHKAINNIDDQIAARKADVNALYNAARDSSGRSVPLNGGHFTEQATRLLDDAMVGGALPNDVRTHLNKIAMGEVPFDIHYAEQLKTRIGQLQRATNDGSTRYALGLVRQALDDTPIQLGASSQLGDEAITAFNKAREANRNMMQWVESSPAIKAVYKGEAVPDTFVNKYLFSPSATADDVSVLSQNLNGMSDDMRSAIAQHLKAKALNGAADEVGRFSAAGYNKAMSQLGNRKLGAFFSPDDLDQLKAIGNVASYTTVQPVGSAVNNSNTAATLGGWALDALDGMNNKVRIPFLGDTIKSGMNTLHSMSAQNVAPSLIRQPQMRSLLDAPNSNWAIPASVTGLLATPVFPYSEDN